MILMMMMMVLVANTSMFFCKSIPVLLVLLPLHPSMNVALATSVVQFPGLLRMESHIGVLWVVVIVAVVVVLDGVKSS